MAQLRTAAALAAVLLAGCKGTEDWIEDLKTVHDESGRLKLDPYDAGQLSYEAMSGLAEQETLTLSQTARTVAICARIIEGVDQPLLRTQAIALIARLAVRYPFPAVDEPYAVLDPVKAGEAAQAQIEKLDQFDRIFEVESVYLPALKNPDRAAVEGALVKLREVSGVDAGRTFEVWEAWWKANRDAFRVRASEGSREPLRTLAGLKFGDPEKPGGLKSSRAVLLYLGFRAALYDYPEIRAETEAATLRVARQTTVLAIAQSLRGDDARLRAEAARAAEVVRDPGLGGALLYALQRERDVGARVAIMRALALYPGKGSVGALVAQIPDEEEFFKAAGDADRSLALEARRSLAALTGEDFGLDAAAWRLWWEKTGKSRWP